MPTTPTYHVLFTLDNRHTAEVPNTRPYASEHAAKTLACAIMRDPDHIIDHCFVGRRSLGCPGGVIWHTRDEHGIEWELLQGGPPFEWPGHYEVLR